jgi:heme exporter protein C
MTLEESTKKVALCSGRVIDYIFPVLLFIAVPLSLHFTFIVAPDEKVLGPVQRVLYYHVGSAFSAYLMLGVLFVSSIFYLAFRNIIFFNVAKASARVAFLFSTLVLISGMLWGYSSWNTWWNWEPRLVSMLVLWLFLLSFLYLQSVSFGTIELRAVVSSVLGILCALQVPLVVFSIKLLDRTQQLHPEVVATGGLTEPGYRYAMILSSLTLLALSVYFCRVSYRVIALEERIRIANRKILMTLQEP